MKKVIKYILFILIIVIFAGTLYLLYWKSQKKPEQFKTTQPVIMDIIKKTVATGSVNPRKEIEIKPHISGIIDHIYLKSGQKLSKGDAIAKIKIIPDMIALNNAENRLNKAMIALEDSEKTYKIQKELYDNSMVDGHLSEGKLTPNLIKYNNAKYQLNKAKLAFEDANKTYQREKALYDKSLKEGTLNNRSDSYNMIKLSNAEFRVNNAKLAIEDAQKTYERNKSLHSKSLVSASVLQQSNLALKKAKEELIEAKNNYRLVKEETTDAAKQRYQTAEIALKKAKAEIIESENNFLLVKEEVTLDTEKEFQKAEVALKKAQEELVSARNNLQLIKDGFIDSKDNDVNTIIKSTIDGMILDIPIKEGNLVIESNSNNAGTTIASVADMNDMIFEGNIDESEVGKLKIGMELILSIGAIESEKFSAKLEYISPKGRMVNGAIQFEVKASLKLKKDFFVRAGYSANADIVLKKKTQVMAIDEAAITIDKDKVFVEIEKKPQVFERKLIRTGLSDGIHIEVIEGLTTQDKIKLPN